MPATKNESVAAKLEKLEALLEWFESDEVSVEAAIKKYEEALVLAGELETQLKNAKNQVEVIKKKFNK